MRSMNGAACGERTPKKTYNRIGQTSQSHFQGYLKRFFRWCIRTGFLTADPAISLEAIPKNDEKTQP